MAGCALIFIFSVQVLHFFVGYRYESPVFLLKVMCVATVVVCMNIPACLVLLASNGKKNYLKIAAIGTLVNIAANIILVQFFEAKGIVMAVLLTELFIAIGLYWEVYQLYIHNKSDGRNFLRSVFMK
jgi:O-antigen/teichoic acid export membrane protein